MRFYPALCIITFSFIVKNFTQCQPEIKTVILSEIKNSGENGRFIELRSREENVSLDGYFLVVLDYSLDRNTNSGRVLRVKAATSLRGKSMTGFYGFVGMCMYYICAFFQFSITNTICIVPLKVRVSAHLMTHI